MTAAVAEAVAPAAPQDTERTRQLEDRVVALTAELKVANDRCAPQACADGFIRPACVSLHDNICTPVPCLSLPSLGRPSCSGLTLLL